MENDKAVEQPLDPASSNANAPAQTELGKIPDTPIAKAVESDDTEAFYKLREKELKGEKPESEPAPKDKEETPKPEVKTDGPHKTPDPASDKPQTPSKRSEESELRKAKRLLAQRDEELKQLRESQVRKPESEPAPQKQEEVDDRPDIGDFDTIAEWKKADTKWLKGHLAKLQESVKAEFTTRETKAAQEKAQRDQQEHIKALDATAAKLDKELGDFNAAVREEGTGIAHDLSQAVANWAVGKGEVALRGLYAIAKLSEEQREEFLALPPDEQQAEILWHGKQKPIAKAPASPPPGAPQREPGPPPKEAGGRGTPATDRIKHAVESDDTETFAKLRNEELKAAGRRY